MLGARSALFAPFADIGLIIIDEEHEPTYKQEQKPTYRTHEVALERARLNNAVVIFGSATPSLETYAAAKEGRFTLVEMLQRIDGRGMPPVRMIDCRNKAMARRIITPPLSEALMRVLARREQAIVFLNRRGFSSGIMCQSCGHVIQCPHCSISLVYHRNPEKLRCHYCDHQRDMGGSCPQCKSTYFTIFGLGTQKVEEELKCMFPQGRVVRLDRDTAAKKGAYQEVYEGFKEENFDILLGTQMIAKGFDFPRVTLVGVVDADTALYLPDFRAAERTFQLITQVAGRAGRGALAGEVVVQSRHPEHYALTAAAHHDYAAFYNQEIEYRRQMKYPPFTRLINVLIRGRNEEKVEGITATLCDELIRWQEHTKIPVDILGPTPAARTKIQTYFRWQILLKGDPVSVMKAATEARKYNLPSGIIMTIDVDPQDTL
jgi:primosomal protein N' (replication factor Y)